MTGEFAVEAVRLFVALLIAASLVALAARRIGVPDEVAFLLVGLVGAFLLPTTIAVTPSIVLLVLLPGLVFEAAYRVRFSELRRSLWAVVLLAIPGVLITAVVVAFVYRAVEGWLADVERIAADAVAQARRLGGCGSLPSVRAAPTSKW